MPIRKYEAVIAATDRLPLGELRPVVLGLFGEVGSIMATSKKLHREGHVYTAFHREAQEELGDTLWYLAALCRRLDLSLEAIIKDVIAAESLDKTVVAGTTPESPIAEIQTFPDLTDLDQVLLALGAKAADLLTLEQGGEDARHRVIAFTQIYLKAVQVNGIPFAAIIAENIQKALGGFATPDPDILPTFDTDFPTEERIPDEFRIEITQRASGKSYLRMNGVYIGDPLTDNISDSDGYRFHDVFHLSHAAVLHWSPVFRALIRHKRKSKPEIDESQDSGRPIVIEEGLTAYIFAYSKNLDFFREQNQISLGLLKTVKNFVRGYEVEECPTKLWEDAILQGYEVFRKVRENEGGIIIGNRKDRRLTYK